MIALDLLLVMAMLYPLPPVHIARLSYYGQNDGYFGRRTAASWHGIKVPGIPETVTTMHPGVAASSRHPFGTHLRLTRLCACNGEPSPRDGSKVDVWVVDRMGRDDPALLDAWVAPWLEMATLETGCIRVSVEMIP